MKQRYLIAMDMDGTLLDEDKKISQETSDYLRQLQAEGNVIAIASGRPFRAIEPYYREIGLTGPVICYNGAYVTDPVNHKFPSHHTEIKKEIITSLIADVGPENFLNVMCETNDEAWVITDDPALETFFWKTGITVHQGPMAEILDKDPFTMIILTKDHDADDSLVKVAFSNPNMGLRFWGNSTYSELYFLNVNKGSALLEIAEVYDIDPKNIIALGDGENDVEMLQSAAVGVAMKNSEEVLFAHADMISLDDNNHDGVKKTLEYLLATNH